MLKKINDLKNRLEKKLQGLKWKIDCRGDYAFLTGYDKFNTLVNVIICVSEIMTVVFEYSLSPCFSYPRDFRKAKRIIKAWCRKNKIKYEGEMYQYTVERYFEPPIIVPEVEV